MARIWTPKDYFDPFPGIEAGRARRQQNTDEEMRREDRKQKAIDNAVNDRRYEDQLAFQKTQEANRISDRTADNARLAEDQKMRQAMELSRLGVEPVMGPNGQIDWSATSTAAEKQAQMKQSATVLGTLHGFQGGPTSLNQEEYALSQTPDYKNAYAKATQERMIKESAQAATLEQIGARVKGALEEQALRNEGRPGTKPQAAKMASRTVDMGNGQKMTIPMDPEEAAKMADSAEKTKVKDPIDEAMRAVRIAKENGQSIDVEIGPDGMPRIQNSWMNHDASKNQPGSYDRQIERLMRLKTAAGGDSAGPATGSRTNSAPIALRYQGGKLR